MAATYDVIVIGAGGVGSAALYHLAKRGVKVLGLDRFAPPHDRGSSHGRTRIIRQAYFEHPDYVPLLSRAYELWHELSEISGKQLHHEVGLLQAGPLSGHVVPGVLEAARRHNLSVDRLNVREAQGRFPQFQMPDDWQAAFEQRAGFLDVEDCVAAHLKAARTLGANLQTGVSVLGWRTVGSGLVVQTDQGEFHATKLVVSAGAWAESLLQGLNIRLEVRRKPVFWYPTKNELLSANRGCPCYLFETAASVFYGIAQCDDFGFKVAEHSGGLSVQDPLKVDRELNSADQNRVEDFLSAHIPSVGRPFLHHGVCMYTMSPDENFIIDVHPNHSSVSFAAGLSGHGFKFTSVLGEALADLALNGETALPIGFLNCRRFGTV